MKRPQYYWGVLGNKMFYVTDSKFKLLDECPAFNDKGNFSSVVYDLAKKYGFEKTLLTNIKTESTLEEAQKAVENVESLVNKYNLRKQREARK